MREEHYTVDEKQKSVLMTEDGYEAAEDVLEVSHECGEALDYPLPPLPLPLSPILPSYMKHFTHDVCGVLSC